MREENDKKTMDRNSFMINNLNKIKKLSLFYTNKDSYSLNVK